MKTTFKDAIKPEDIVAVLNDREGVSRWLVFDLTPNIAGAMTTRPERRFITVPSSPLHSGSAYLIRSIQADGYFLSQTRPASQEALAKVMAEAGIVDQDILRGYLVAQIIENENLRAEIFAPDIRTGECNDRA